MASSEDGSCVSQGLGVLGRRRGGRTIFSQPAVFCLYLSCYALLILKASFLGERCLCAL